LRDDNLEVVKTDFIVGLIACACLIFVCAIVLDLLAVVLDFGQAKCCATTLEEVTKGTELSKVLLFTIVGESGSAWFFVLYVSPLERQRG
jgi:hypothetical protein